MHTYREPSIWAALNVLSKLRYFFQHAFNKQPLFAYESRSSFSLEEVQMTPGYVENVMSIPINFFKSPLDICPKSSVDEKARDMFCADIFCGEYIGQTGCESLILSIRQAGECSGCNASDVRQKAVPLVFYCRLKS